MDETVGRERESGEEDKSLYKRLALYADSDYYPYHMPGHKRNVESGEMADFYRLDITEIDGFDNLHHAQGVIKEAQGRANRLYGADETYYLVGGSTCGVLASILATVRRGEEILIARNCHRSVYHAAILQELTLRYYYPRMIREYDIYDGVDAAEIGRLLDEYPDCSAVIITSPTYEGIISDVDAVARAVHDRGKILIVDEAHGAHLGSGAITAGADLVVHSLHKTLPAMTQTALLHVNGERVDRAKLQKYLAILQSSSPSYILMASIDSCMRYVETHGAERISIMREEYQEFLRRTGACRRIRVGKMADVLETDYCLKAWDMGKLVLSVKGTNMNGQQLYNILREKYHLQMEMASGSYVLAMMTMMDTAEGWQRLADALLQIDGTIERASERERYETSECAPGCAPRIRLTIAQAFHSKSEAVDILEAEGRIAAGFVNLYPPGIPLLVPGEVIEKDILSCIRESIRMGLQVQGLTEDRKAMVVE